MAQWIEYKGKKIFYLDCKNCQKSEFYREMDALEKEYEKTGHAGEKNQILVMIDLTHSPYTTEEAKIRMQDVAKKSAAYAFAVVGVSGIKRIIGQAVRRDMYFAKGEAEAKEWLIEQEKPE